jgi:hypothetical protein
MNKSTNDITKRELNVIYNIVSKFIMKQIDEKN